MVSIKRFSLFEILDNLFVNRSGSCVLLMKLYIVQNLHLSFANVRSYGRLTFWDVDSNVQPVTSNVRLFVVTCACRW